MNSTILSTALVQALTDASNARPQDDKHIVFLNSLSNQFRNQYAGRYKVDQKRDPLSGRERLYDICIFKETPVPEEKWGDKVDELSGLFAAIEIENEQGPKYCYEDLWKVVYSRAEHRIFCGGIKKEGYGGGDLRDGSAVRKDRIDAIRAFYGGVTTGLFVCFYPDPSEWLKGLNHSDHVFVTQLP